MGRLVITRKIGQKFLLDNDIKIQILETNKNSVRVLIDAPDDVVILREEIVDKYKDVGSK